MTDWLTQNSSLVQIIVACITAVVWIFYLQVIVSGLRRQRRTEILIHLGGSRGLDARTFVSNLGFEPIYVLEILMTFWSENGKKETSILDRTEIDESRLTSPSQVTFQGPLKSGEFVDIGSFADMLQRAHNQVSDGVQSTDINRIELTIAASTAASSSIVAARRAFNLEQCDGHVKLCPQTLYATQIRSWWGRNKIRQQLEAHLRK